MLWSCKQFNELITQLIELMDNDRKITLGPGSAVVCRKTYKRKQQKKNMKVYGQKIEITTTFQKRKEKLLAF